MKQDKARKTIREIEDILGDRRMKQEKFEQIMDMFADDCAMNLEQRRAISELIDDDNQQEIKNLRETAAHTCLSKELTEDQIYVPTEAVHKFDEIMKSRRQPRSKYKPVKKAGGLLGIPSEYADET